MNTIAYTNIPSIGSMELPEYYTKFLRYYPNCEFGVKQWLVRHVQPQWTIFDVGANIGYHTILASWLATEGKVYAFEPTSTFEKLKANIAWHSQTGKRPHGEILPYNMGLSDRSGRRQDAVFRIWGHDAEVKEYIFITLDDFIEQNAITRLDCIKIDVDSFELEVLRGAERVLSRFNPFVLIEIEDQALCKRNTCSDDVFAFFRQHGYDKALALDANNCLLRRGTQFNPDDLTQFDLNSYEERRQARKQAEIIVKKMLNYFPERVFVEDEPTPLKQWNALRARSTSSPDQLHGVAHWLDTAKPYGKIVCCEDKVLEASYRCALHLCAPYTAKEGHKVRVGSGSDGGYVMLDPGKGGAAFSFGIGAYTPWDLEMAQRGFEVFQFDGTIEMPPQKHPNLHFFRCNIGEFGLNNLDKIFSITNCHRNNSAILQMDIEGAEWNFLANQNPQEMNRFSQIIIEFHDLLNYRILMHSLHIFSKLRETHTPVHFHYNNSSTILCFKDFLVSGLWEISYVRNDLYQYEPSNISYPTPLDAPNNPLCADIFIGNFVDFLQR